METGLIKKWVLVHNGLNVITKHYNNNQTTVSKNKVETFDNKQDLENRIIELKLIDLEPEMIDLESEIEKVIYNVLEI